MVGAQEHVLRYVLGLRLADDARGDPQHHLTVAIHELLEGPEVSGERCVHELLVRRRHRPLKDGLKRRKVTTFEVSESPFAPFGRW